MPLDENILGFSNRWYREVIDSAASWQLEEGLNVRVISAPLFIATKFEAFNRRGKGDLSSHDLEDIVSVIDGRESLLAEVRGESAELRAYLRIQIRRLLARAGFMDALPGLLLPDAISQLRIGGLLRRLQELADR